MAIPDPEVGLVIHFNYLWKREHTDGRENGRYARPCAIVLAQRRDADGSVVVMVAPITHSAPHPDSSAIELPPALKRHLGLDEERSWVVVDEVNEFVWPGHDLEPNAAGEFAYGVVPDRFFQKIKTKLLDNAKAGRLGRVPR